MLELLEKRYILSTGVVNLVDNEPGATGGHLLPLRRVWLRVKLIQKQTELRGDNRYLMMFYQHLDPAVPEVLNFSVI